MTGTELLIVVCAVGAIVLTLIAGSKRGKVIAKTTRIFRVDDFFQKYKSVMSDELLKKVSKASLNGDEHIKIDIYTLEMLDAKLARQNNGESA